MASNLYDHFDDIIPLPPAITNIELSTLQQLRPSPVSEYIPTPETLTSFPSSSLASTTVFGPRHVHLSSTKPHVAPLHTRPMPYSMFQSHTASSSSQRPLQIPTSNIPTVSILSNVMEQQQKLSMRRHKDTVLDRAFADTIDRCLVCWIWGCILIPKHERPFTNCQSAPARSLPELRGWISLQKQTKSLFITNSHHHCYSCGLPSGASQLPSHGDGVEPQCSNRDWAFLILGAFFYYPHLRTEAAKAFPMIPQLSKWNDFIAWCTIFNPYPLYWNGLELVIWICQQM
ncbi:hypothetical protein M422DRAFT_53144 [Sphaerobolus stellatus SS14]|uniref:Uncharacterized protein n=1 Tax=Sphaerobolus stellatus (strain SS14) TaxID=990650 RepID=A0A0C9V343_SPHS4|nr:hypothetical protein M422DRAFT_53144 [Sphaerobolus stellatus SS14]